jgi:hypothetical protein
MYAQRIERGASTVTAPLVPVNDLRTALGLDVADTAVTALLSSAIAAATYTAEAHCGRTFAEQAMTEHFHHPQSTLLLSQTPVTAIASVQDVDGTDIPYWWMQGDILKPMRMSGNSWRFASHFRDDYITVKYTGGYTLLPPDLSQAITDIAKEVYLGRARSGAVSAENIEGIANTEYVATGLTAMTPLTRAMLDRYRTLRL